MMTQMNYLKYGMNRRVQEMPELIILIVSMFSFGAFQDYSIHKAKSELYSFTTVAIKYSQTMKYIMAVNKNV